MNKHILMSGEEPFTERQEAVLDAALALLVAGGEKAITTARIARAANCSKESLYKWFGDRDGILAAMITYQASKVRVPAGSDAVLRPLEAYISDFQSFGVDLLTVLSGPTSMALNRLAIGQASAEGSALGSLLIERGRSSVRARATGLLERAKMAGHVRFDDVNDAFHTLYGLIVADGHVRSLLGEQVSFLTQPNMRKAHVHRSIDTFFKLYGTQAAL